MFLPLALTRRVARLLPGRLPRARVAAVPQGRPRVLIAGIYIADKPNTVEHLVVAFGGARSCDVEQRWSCIRGAPPSAAVDAVTLRRFDDYVPKWTMLSDLIGERPWERFDYVVFTDDDIRVAPGFLDTFVALQQRFGFALCQPARTWASYTDWPIVRRRLFSVARETRFVESGPLVSMSAPFLRVALPFSEESPMGWGYDLVWPKLAAAHALTLGVIDATPVDHSLRARGALYDDSAEIARMGAFLSTRDHIRTFETVRTYR